MSTLLQRTNHRTSRVAYFVFASLLLGISATFWATGRLAQDQTGSGAALESFAGKRSGPQRSHAALPVATPELPRSQQALPLQPARPVLISKSLPTW